MKASAGIYWTHVERRRLRWVWRLDVVDLDELGDWARVRTFATGSALSRRSAQRSAARAVHLLASR